MDAFVLRSGEFVARVRQVDQPKGRRAVWSCRVERGGQVVFDDSRVALKLWEAKPAQWLAEMVFHAAEAGVFIPPGGQGESALAWKGELDDDCVATWQGLHGHVEHMDGPRGKGGRWYCGVGRGADDLFATWDHQVEPRSSEAGRWLCENVMRSIGAAVFEREVVGAWEREAADSIPV